MGGGCSGSGGDGGGSGGGGCSFTFPLLYGTLIVMSLTVLSYYSFSLILILCLSLPLFFLFCVSLPLLLTLFFSLFILLIHVFSLFHIILMLKIIKHTHTCTRTPQKKVATLLSNEPPFPTTTNDNLSFTSTQDERC